MHPDRVFLCGRLVWKGLVGSVGSFGDIGDTNLFGSGGEVGGLC